ncbi:MAG: ABC transporter permease [Trueperaceae bacterium]|nr:ABC transporter permease [Trueperaceae bacterium]
MFAFIIRRLLALPVVLFAVSLVIVGLLQLLSPTQRASAFVTSPQQARNLDAVIEARGLDQPFPVQYWSWLTAVAEGNLGYSRTASMPVMEAIGRFLPATAELTLFSIIPVIGFGIWLGTQAALRRNTIVDQISRVIAIIGWSLPTFVFGIWILSWLYGGYGWFGIGRISNELQVAIAEGSIVQYTRFMTLDAILNGRWDMFVDALMHLVLPVVTLSAVVTAQIMRVMRGSLLEALSQDYVRTARAKGLEQRAINLKHARRNALIPVLTLSGLLIATLLNGTVVVETIFNYRGLGLWFATAAVQLDIPAVVGYGLVVAVIIVVVNLLVDIGYAVVDPRIRYD